MTKTKELLIFTCPECGRKLSVPELKSGIFARCPACKKRIKIPSKKK